MVGGRERRLAGSGGEAAPGEWGGGGYFSNSKSGKADIYSNIFPCRKKNIWTQFAYAKFLLPMHGLILMQRSNSLKAGTEVRLFCWSFNHTRSLMHCKSRLSSNQLLIDWWKTTPLKMIQKGNIQSTRRNGQNFWNLNMPIHFLVLNGQKVVEISNLFFLNAYISNRI